jgi:hypothetical protein
MWITCWDPLYGLFIGTKIIPYSPFKIFTWGIKGAHEEKLLLIYLLVEFIRI